MYGYEVGDACRSLHVWADRRSLEISRAPIGEIVSQLSRWIFWCWFLANALNLLLWCGVDTSL